MLMQRLRMVLTIQLTWVGLLMCQTSIDALMHQREGMKSTGAFAYVPLPEVAVGAWLRAKIGTCWQCYVENREWKLIWLHLFVFGVKTGRHYFLSTPRSSWARVLPDEFSRLVADYPLRWVATTWAKPQDPRRPTTDISFRRKENPREIPVKWLIYSSKRNGIYMVRKDLQT